MEISAININWLSSAIGFIAFVVLWIARSRRVPAAMVEHLSWAALGAFGLYGAVQAIYPIYRFARYRSLNNIPNLEHYLLIGCGIACAAGVIAAIKAWKS